MSPHQLSPISNNAHGIIDERAHYQHTSHRLDDGAIVVVQVTERSDQTIANATMSLMYTSIDRGNEGVREIIY